jgi:hypothetical protein
VLGRKTFLVKAHRIVPVVAFDCEVLRSTKGSAILAAYFFSTQFLRLYFRCFLRVRQKLSVPVRAVGVLMIKLSVYLILSIHGYISITDRWTVHWRTILLNFSVCLFQTTVICLPLYLLYWDNECSFWYIQHR